MTVVDKARLDFEKKIDFIRGLGSEVQLYIGIGR
jgi:hypothetical protein